MKRGNYPTKRVIRILAGPLTLLCPQLTTLSRGSMLLGLTIFKKEPQAPTSCIDVVDIAQGQERSALAAGVFAVAS